MAQSPVLEVRDYSLSYTTPAGVLNALTSINLAIPRAKTLGLVGESGSGKTSLAWAIMRYLPANAHEIDGDLLLAGDSLRQKTKKQIADIRGRRIGMVFQDPSTSLNPSLTLGNQLSETLIRHRKLSQVEARQQAEQMLERTGIVQPAAMMKRYPHEASGGEKQRVVIATAFACNPELLLFDEPTTALDVITARQILELFAGLQEETGVAALYISHDLALVSSIAHEVAVINRGSIVEKNTTSVIFRSPQHAYTRALIEASPRPDIRLSSVDLPPSAPGLLETRALTVRYGTPSLLKRLTGRDTKINASARDIDIQVRRGEILGLVGESGSGKSTIARAIAGIANFSGGITLDGKAFHERAALDRPYRRSTQIIFQHPDSSLNPRQTVGSIIARPLQLYRLARGKALIDRVAALLEQVRLPADYARRYPHELSGGEKQRVAIARAFAAEPKLVICDEVTSSLDVSVQAAVARLLVLLQQDTGAGCLFITHDLNLVRQLAHRIAVIYRGELVDVFNATDFDLSQLHPYSRSLLNAMPAPISGLR